MLGNTGVPSFSGLPTADATLSTNNLIGKHNTHMISINSCLYLIHSIDFILRMETNTTLTNPNAGGKNNDEINTQISCLHSYSNHCRQGIA